MNLDQITKSNFPIILAPLAGVSDHPFRRICYENGADLCYVEMLSATALNFRNSKTLQMMERHADEPRLGVQVTAGDPEILGPAVAFLSEHNYETIDLNMGCPVTKIVKAGCGSAIIRDPDLVYKLTKVAVENADVPVSVKIRLGWDHETKNFLEVGAAAESAGAKWLTVHGRTRSDNYSDPVDLFAIQALKNHLDLPVIGNGNIFGSTDVKAMKSQSQVDGIMVSRGALGNPWIFDYIKGNRTNTSLEEWWQVLKRHLDYQKECYGDQGRGAICMRKHFLWYVKGWPHARKLRGQLMLINSISEASELIEDYIDQLIAEGTTHRDELELAPDNRFLWDPKFDMDRQLDRGIGHLGLETPPNEQCN